MEWMKSKLEAISRKRACDAAWAGADAAQFVLSQFREKALADGIAINYEITPHYSFNLDALKPPPTAAFRVGDWKVHKDYVFGMLESSTGLKPMFHLNLRLGEGTGGVLAAPILLGAAATLREMRTFAEAGVPGA